MLTNRLRKLLHRKAFEYCTVSPATPAAGSFCVSDKYNAIPDALAFYFQGASNIYRYDGNEDAWLQLPNSGIAGTFGAGGCGEFRGLGAMGGSFNQTATGGSTTTIVTNRTIVRSLKGCRIRVIAGAGVGYDNTISENTIGANAVITVPVNGVAFDATTVYQIFSGSLWVQSAGASAGFSVYDLATNAWTARATVGVTWGGEGALIGTPSIAGAFATGTAASSTSTTITVTGKSWETNQWANYQIRITGGTGIGQIRTVASNTSNQITVSAAWVVNPDGTSTYEIEGNDDFFYLIGNTALITYRYSVSANAWSNVNPVAARAGAHGAGGTGNWVDNVPEWSATTDDPTQWHQTSSLWRQNGRYIYSFRGAGFSTLDIYDIAANTWYSNVTYGNSNETFTSGSSGVDVNGLIYLQKENTGRLFYFDVARNVLKSLGTNPSTQGAASVGQKMFILPFSDGGDTIYFLYTLHHTRFELVRMVLI